MKISDVKVTVIRTPNPMGAPGAMMEANLYQVLADGGVEGDFLVGGGRAAGRGLAEVIRDSVKPMLVGRDPFDRESIWQTLVFRSSNSGFFSMNVPGAIDVCLWDLAGKATGLPVYKLLGGYRDKIRAYASILGQESPKAYGDYATKLVAQGYTAVKLHLRGTPEDHIEACKATREAVGDKVDVLLDSNCRYDRREALMVGRAIEKLNFYWYEEPLPNTDIDGYKELCQILDIPIAATETLYYGNPSHFTPYLTEHVADILRTDAERGITLAKKLSDLCDAFNVKCELHGWGFAMAQAANLHVAGATRNSDFFEKMEPGEMYDIGVKDKIQIDNEGFVHLPTKPGLGIDIDFDEIKKRTILAV